MRNISGSPQAHRMASRNIGGNTRFTNRIKRHTSKPKEQIFEDIDYIHFDKPFAHGSYASIYTAHKGDEQYAVKVNNISHDLAHNNHLLLHEYFMSKLIDEMNKRGIIQIPAIKHQDIAHIQSSKQKDLKGYFAALMPKGEEPMTYNPHFYRQTQKLNTALQDLPTFGLIPKDSSSQNVANVILYDNDAHVIDFAFWDIYRPNAQERKEKSQKSMAYQIHCEIIDQEIQKQKNKDNPSSDLIETIEIYRNQHMQEKIEPKDKHIDLAEMRYTSMC